MIKPIKEMDIVAIGDDELINELRLAGISRYNLIREGPETAREVKEAVSRLVADPQVGVVVILEEYARHAGDIIDRIKEDKRMTPVFIEAPSKHGTLLGDVRSYYKAYIRGFIGFDIEI